MLDEARAHPEKQFKKILQRANGREIELRTDIAVGHVVEQIVHRAEIDHVDLVVLGRRGKSRFERMRGPLQSPCAFEAGFPKGSTTEACSADP
jgi:nucleotide-binding universal stress UspA family protein